MFKKCSPFSIFRIQEDELATLYSQYCKCKSYADEALHVHKAEIDEVSKFFFHRFFPISNLRLEQKTYRYKFKMKCRIDLRLRQNEREMFDAYFR